MKIVDIEVPESRQRAMGDIDQLAESISQVGLLNPILVTRNRELVAGLHRLEACKSLGWDEVKVVVLKGDDVSVELAEIDENLMRNELTVLERGEHHNRRKALLEAKGVVRSSKKPLYSARGAVKPHYTETISEKISQSSRKVREEMQIATRLDDAAKAVVEGTELSDKKKALLSITKTKDPKEQERLAKEQLQRLQENRGVVSAAEGYDSDAWYTPSEYIEAVRKVMGSIDLDPASNNEAQEVVKANKYFTKEDDGLAQDWSGNVFLNPPYSNPLMGQFIDKLMAAYDQDAVYQAILVTNNATDTRWCQALLQRVAVCFTAGRVKFWRPGVDAQATRQGQIFFYFGEDPEVFDSVFSKFGTVCGPY